MLTIVKEGLAWGIINKDRRTVSHAGRLFEAARYRKQMPTWSLYELTADGTVYHGDYFKHELAQTVKELVG